jgi:general secretion pathway protein A
VDENKTVVLIIDEGQKIPVFCLEILREFLNYETNEYKLLQIAIFAQKEFDKVLEEYTNLADRINLYHLLEPLDFRDTRLMIQFRLKQSSAEAKTPILFSYPALWAIYNFTGGYPRKIINLCHRTILTMIIQNRSKIGWFMVRSCVKRDFSEPKKKWRWVSVTALVGLLVVTITAGIALESLKIPAARKPEGLKTASVQNKEPEIKPPAAQKDTDLEESKKGVVQPAQIISDKQTEILESFETGQSPVVATAAESSTETPSFEKKLPVVLGQVALRHRGTLWGLIEDVYGIFDYKYKYLKNLTQANTFIKDPDYVEVDRLISVPAIPATVKPLPVEVWWVNLEEKDRLDDAINILRAYPRNAPPIRIIPYWSSISGLKFAVLLREYFFDETSALAKLKKMPPSLATGGKVLSMWDKDIVFYADPFLLDRRQ